MSGPFDGGHNPDREIDAIDIRHGSSNESGWHSPYRAGRHARLPTGAVFKHIATCPHQLIRHFAQHRAVLAVRVHQCLFGRSTGPTGQEGA